MKFDLQLFAEDAIESQTSAQLRKGIRSLKRKLQFISIKSNILGKVIPIGLMNPEDNPEESNIGKKKLTTWKNQFKIASTN